MGGLGCKEACSELMPTLFRGTCSTTMKKCPLVLLGEIVENNDCGFKTHPTDAKTVADAVVKLADNPGLCVRCATNARQLAEEEFAREKQAAKLEAALFAVTQ